MFKVRVRDGLTNAGEEYTVYALRGEKPVYFLIYNKQWDWHWVLAENYVPVE